MWLFGKKKKKQQQEAARLAAEQEAARVAAEQEAARVAAEKELARVAAEQEAEAARIAAEQEAAEKEAAAKRSAAAKKAAATRAANKAEAERIEAERAEAEAARIAAAQAEAERKAAEQAALRGFVSIKPSRDGRFVYVIYAGNKQVIAKSAQTYASVATCRSAVESVAKIAASVPVEDQTLVDMETQKYPKFELYMDKGAKYRFRLCASNGQNLLTCTQGYTQKASCKNGIQSVITNCMGRVEISTETDAE